jgi:hypothetical protein
VNQRCDLGWSHFVCIYIHNKQGVYNNFIIFKRALKHDIILHTCKLISAQEHKISRPKNLVVTLLGLIFKYISIQCREGVIRWMFSWRLSYGSWICKLSVQWVPITTKVVSSTPAHGEMSSIQLYVIKYVSDLRHDITEILLQTALDIITL